MVAYIDHTALPPGGSNIQGDVIHDEELFATKKVVTVGQLMGLVRHVSFIHFVFTTHFFIHFVSRDSGGGGHGRGSGGRGPSGQDCLRGIARDLVH